MEQIKQAHIVACGKFVLCQDGLKSFLVRGMFVRGGLRQIDVNTCYIRNIQLNINLGIECAELTSI